MSGELNRQPVETSEPYEQVGFELEPATAERTQIDRAQPGEAIQPLITKDERNLNKMIRRALGGGDGGIRTKPRASNESYHRHNHYRRKS